MGRQPSFFFSFFSFFRISSLLCRPAGLFFVSVLCILRYIKPMMGNPVRADQPPADVENKSAQARGRSTGALSAVRRHAPADRRGRRLLVDERMREAPATLQTTLQDGLLVLLLLFCYLVFKGRRSNLLSMSQSSPKPHDCGIGSLRITFGWCGRRGSRLRAILPWLPRRCRDRRSCGRRGRTRRVAEGGISQGSTALGGHQCAGRSHGPSPSVRGGLRELPF